MGVATCRNMTLTMMLLTASLPALVAVLLFVGTVRLQKPPRRSAPSTVTPLPVANPAALARALEAQARRAA